MTRRALLVLFLLLALPLRAATETDRLMTLARVWSEVRYLHPYMLTRSIDWDAALVHAIPNVRAAKTDAELASAIDGMLRELGDPVTRVSTKAADRAKADVPLTRTEGDTLILNLGPYVQARGSDELYGELRNLPRQLAAAKALLIDVRYSGTDAEDIDWVLTSLDGVTAKTLTAPAMQAVFHSGYRPQLGETSGGYYTAMLTVPGPILRAAKTAPARIAIVTDGTSRLPLGAVALHEGGAVIVSSAPFGDEAVAMTHPIKIGEGQSAIIRVALPLAGGIGADVIAADPVAEGLAILKGDRPMPAKREPAAAAAAVPQWKPDAAYATMVYPDVEYRLLAAFRLWSVIDRFYPYKNLIGDWDAVLAEFIPRFIDAKNADEYGLAVVEMDARVEDGHSGASGHPAADKIYGTFRPPLEVRRVEGQFVVTKVLEPGTGANPGDVVVSIDGEPFADRVARLHKYITASTETARINRIASVALRGPRDSAAALKLQGADGVVREVSVPRAPYKPADKNGAWKLLDGDNKEVGYVDLMKLMPAQVDEMFTALEKTRAIVFDLRGYPNGTAWPIAPHVNTRGAKIGAQFRRVLFSGVNTVEEGASGFFFEQPLPSADKPKYRGKMIVLIDDRAISQSEHSCLFFEAANGATFIGSPTAGANGDVTNLTLPGGFRVGFTGHDVRHADGRQLQRVGIQPDVAVQPTIAGIRAGRDEVLERALAYIHGLPR